MFSQVGARLQESRVTLLFVRCISRPLFISISFPFALRFKRLIQYFVILLSDHELVRRAQRTAPTQADLIFRFVERRKSQTKDCWPTYSLVRCIRRCCTARPTEPSRHFYGVDMRNCDCRRNRYSASDFWCEARGSHRRTFGCQPNETDCTWAEEICCACGGTKENQIIQLNSH